MVISMLIMNNLKYCREEIEKATEEYRKCQEQNLSPVEEEYLESIKNIHSKIKKKDKN